MDHSLCPEMETYWDAWLFLLRATSHGVRKYAEEDSAPLWPWSSMVRRVWSFTHFEDDRWPQEKYHEHHLPYTLLCTSLNVGAYVLPILILLFIVKSWSELDNALRAVEVILDQMVDPELPAEVEIQRRKLERKIEQRDTHVLKLL